MIFNAPYSRENFLEFITEFLPNDYEENISQLSFSHGPIKKITRLGKCQSSLNEIEVFEVIHTSVSDARISLSREIFKFMRQNAKEYALVAFVPENASDIYRFSLISMSYKLKDGKIQIENSNPKRFSFLLGKNQHVRTPQDYLEKRGVVKNLDDLKERFSIEVLTKDFYEELFQWYEKAVNAFVPYPKTDTKKEEHIIRLITRLMFVWFIKQKKLIPDTLFDVSELKTILKDFDQQDSVGGTYYNAILQNLFFATLNCEIPDRSFASDSQGKYGNQDYSIKTKYRDNNGSSWFMKSHSEIQKIFEQIPFLNGGLFECLTQEKGTNDPDDGFSRDKSKRSMLPNNLFFDPEKGIISILKKYNWTIEENSPADIEVALDPELLGKVFENLLGTYNPETKETARKDSGSFYTPRPIVQYMTDESLVAYLSKKLNSSAEKIHSLIASLDLTDEIKQDDKFCNEVIEALQNIKILDPACGSGAFPMGLLNRIVEIITKIKPSVNRYELKLKLLENCIYGVDIQTIAIQISKLRCFISLVCEQEPNGLKEDNFGIHPLPNLETKFVAANTLVALDKGITDEIHYPDKKLDSLRAELRNIRVHQMINVSSFKEKKALRIKDKQICDRVSLLVSDRIGAPNQDTINLCLKHIAELENKRKSFSGKKMKTIVQKVIGNLFELTDRQETLSFDENKQKRDEIDKQIEKLKERIAKENKKVKSSKTEQEIKRLVGWNPYKPTASSEFFDASWMFDIQDGFDIVIGNPPYVQLQKLKGDPLQNIYKNQNYKTYEATGDLYCLFYEKGIDLLKEGGFLCYITSNKWMRAGYGEILRSFFVEYNPVLLIDLGAGVFSSATVDTNILLIEKKAYDKKTYSCTLNDRSQEMSVFIRQHAIPIEYTKENWTILNPIEQSIKSKIEKYGTPLKEWNVSIYRGILTGCNEAFIIDGKKRAELIAEDPKSDEIIRPILRGRDIKRYGYEFADLWLINIECGFTNKNCGTMLPEEFIKFKYPAIYKHFMQVANTKTKGKGLINRDDKGDYWWELRSCAYTNDFSKQKIMYSEIVRSPQFYLDNEGIFYPEATTFIMTGKNLEYLLLALHSKILTYAFKTYYAGGGLGEDGYRYKKAFLEKLPIPKVSNMENTFYKQLIKDNKTNEIEEFLINAFNLSDEERNFILKNIHYLK